MTRIVPSMKFEPKPQYSGADVGVLIPREELADLITLAVRVGRGTETQKKLLAAIHPHGIRRKE